MTTLSPASSSVDEKHAEEAKAPMAGLSDREREIIERQIDAPKLTVGYFALFRYASKAELGIMVIAIIASIAAGAVMPLMTVCTDELFDCLPHLESREPKRKIFVAWIR
jgi:ATP-binding cassette subfamily B (MDR/TAP) protein 1